MKVLYVVKVDPLRIERCKFFFKGVLNKLDGGNLFNNPFNNASIVQPKGLENYFVISFDTIVWSVYSSKFFYYMNKLGIRKTGYTGLFEFVALKDFIILLVQYGTSGSFELLKKK